ncbi:hypothetical protein NGJ69_20970 [Atlantibacter hermannii]|uniref:hypothetical protein n=1 Tax=Atlantibacter hermannii TaxID=565 RepID=UPI002DBEF470|nr:hypothetical protein [Atlantibacter hermannii]MEB7926151.1 hypothetical protein [Atlantibacter hermannii]
MQIQNYSTLFSCLYDEREPVGNLGRGAHYSVFRSVEWLDVLQMPLKLPQIHDFSVIWDEDHDTRVIDVIEHIYMAGLLSPIQFIGERKGILTVIVAANFYFGGIESHEFESKIQTVCGKAIQNDSWDVEVGMFDRSLGSPHQTDTAGIISAEAHRVITYLRNIDSLWQLGTKSFSPRVHLNNSSPLPLIPGKSFP